MAIEFKSEKFRNIWELVTKTHRLKEEDYIKFLEAHTKEDMVNSLIGSYALELIQAALTKGYILDMTYNTLDSLEEGLSAIFCDMQNVYTDEAIANAIARSIASYLILLAINEENCPYEIQDKYSELMSEDAMEELMDVSFCGVCVSLGFDRKVEFLTAAQRSIRIKDDFDYSNLYINTLPIARAYEKATGVNIINYGFVNFLLQKPEGE